MSDFARAAYFGEYSLDDLLRRIAAEIAGTADPMLHHILAGAAVHFTAMKHAQDEERAAEKLWVPEFSDIHSPDLDNAEKKVDGVANYRGAELAFVSFYEQSN